MEPVIFEKLDLLLKVTTTTKFRYTYFANSPSCTSYTAVQHRGSAEYATGPPALSTGSTRPTGGPLDLRCPHRPPGSSW